MHSLGIIRFCHKVEQIKLVGGTEKLFPRWIKTFAMEITPLVNDKVVFDKLGIEIKEIQFPYLITDNDNISKIRFERALARTKKYFHKNGVSELIVDENIGKTNELLNNEGLFRVFDGSGFYGVYIVEILKYICSNMGVKLQNLTVGLMLDDLDGFFELILKDLCTKVRFLSIISLNSENFIPLVKEIYNESGLVVRLEKNTRSKKGDCGILINFSKNKDFVNSNRFSRNFVVINLGADILNKNQNGIIITNIKMKSKDKDMYKHFWTGNSGFCEALAYISSGIEIRDSAALLQRQKKIISALKTAGFYIDGVKGCRGEIGKEALVEYGKRLKPKIV